MIIESFTEYQKKNFEREQMTDKVVQHLSDTSNRELAAAIVEELLASQVSVLNPIVYYYTRYVETAHNGRVVEVCK